MPRASFDLRYLFLKYRDAIVRICTVNGAGDEETGTGFHIGEGLIITARHVAAQKITVIRREPDNLLVPIQTLIFHQNGKVDLAIVKSQFHELSPANPRQRRVCSLPLGQYLDEWLSNDFVLSKVLVMGFPRIPMTIDQIMVSSEAEVNAMAKTNASGHSYFILSSTARGGFSGGPIVSAAGFVLGVVTDALTTGHAEAGFFAATSVEPLLEMLVRENLGKGLCVEGDVWRLLAKRLAKRADSD
jgi:S1-C subfamily serine protease